MNTIELMPGINIPFDVTTSILFSADGNEIGGEFQSRFHGAQWYRQIRKYYVSICGLGGIGSYVSYFISRLGVRGLEIFDMDRIESVNLSGQMFSTSDIGMEKTDAVKRLINKYSPETHVHTRRGRITEETHIDNPIVITGFDNIEARRIVFNSWKENIMINPGIAEEALFIDGRLAAETLQVIAIRGTDLDRMEEYESKYLFNEEDAIQEVCSYKQTSHIAGMIGSIITSIFINFVNNKATGFDFSPVPFFTEFDAQIFNFKMI